ncbi:Glyoxalase-like domain-containing protein [Nocardia amikacinitolerans]|uniref:VOC family protein n=1 Tax=Nocardia amikacinitolerans TaxID=756689 RepID=UPI00082FC241|nr:VOC family protein [Nocardia amikacinitolerans]MCP2319650.1 Glyoxalase-like domain-containing protein [Nocardia amikacinitolerans]
MTLSIANVTFDCENAAALAGFWAELLEQRVDEGANEFFATVGRESGHKPLLMFIKVPDKTPGKNVVHLDLASTEWREQVDRAVALGAKHIGDFDEYGGNWATLADPEGNLFDIGKA